MRTRSPKKAREAQTWNEIVKELIDERPWCTVCGECWFLEGHHIVKRSQGGTSVRGNCIILCRQHHDHGKYGNGMSISVEQAQEIVRLRDR